MKSLFITSILVWSATSFGAPLLTQEQFEAGLQSQIRETLKIHCGLECPSFKAQVQIKTMPLQDLGFESSVQQRAREAGMAEWIKKSTLRLQVSVSPQVERQSIQSLKRVIQQEIANHYPKLKMRVGLQSLPAVLPIDQAMGDIAAVTAEVDPLQQRIQAISPLIWPAFGLVLSLIVLSGFALWLSNRKSIWRARLDAQKESIEVLDPTLDADESPVAVKLSELVSERGDDLAWLIEELSRQHDLAPMKRLIGLVDPVETGIALDLSAVALGHISQSRLTDKSNPAAPSAEDYQWLKTQLRQAHWARQAFERLPAKRFASLTDTQLKLLSEQDMTARQRASLLSLVPPQKWQFLVDHLPIAQKQEVAAELENWPTIPQQEKNDAYRELAKILADQPWGPPVYESSDDVSLIESFLLQLEPKEGDRIASQLRGLGAQVLSPGRLEASLETLSDDEIRQILVDTDFNQVVAFINSIESQSLKGRILELLPQGLRDRLAHARPDRSDRARRVARVEMGRKLRDLREGV